MDKRTNDPSDLSLKNHFKKFFLDHEKLQLEYAKLRKKFSEYQIKSKCDFTSTANFSIDNGNKSPEDLKRELEIEKQSSKSLKAEIARLNEDLKTIEKRYAELLSIVSATKDQAENSRLKELENENKELKGLLEFVTYENKALREESEDRAFTERREWAKQKEKYEEVVIWSKRLNDEFKKLQAKYQEQTNTFNKFLHFIFDFYINKKSIHSMNGIDDVINNFEKCSNDDFDLVKKIDLIEIIIKKSNEKDNDENFNHNNKLANHNTEETSKNKINDLIKENHLLIEENKCLKNEIEELKNLLKNNNISSDLIELKTENAKLSAELRLKEELLEKLSEKFSRNRTVLEENYKRSTEEIKTLDNFIDLIIGKLNGLPTELKNSPDLKELIGIINENDNNLNDDKKR